MTKNLLKEESLEKDNQPLLYTTAVAYPQGFRRRYTDLGAQTMCPNCRKTDKKTLGF